MPRVRGPRVEGRVVLGEFFRDVQVVVFHFQTVSAKKQFKQANVARFPTGFDSACCVFYRPKLC